ncbi:MAG: hypothetical protein MJZ57_07035 [Bacteroidales bacterium]|nr:hypothetical protein [Bacteroidales bacterium]
MKKTLIALTALIGMFLCVSCMHECTCVTQQEFISPGHYTIDIDTSVVPSKVDCYILNIDTTYTFIAYDTDSITPDGHYAVIDSTSGQVVNITICE